MDLINIAVLTAFAINIVYTIVLHYYSHRSRSAHYFRFVGLAVSAWCLSMFFYRIVQNENSVFWARILYMAASFTPSTFLLFCLSFPNRKVRKAHIIPILTLNAIVAFLCIFDDHLIVSVSKPLIGERIIEFAMPAYSLFMIYVPLLFILSFIVLLKKYIKSTGLERAQLGYILVGSFITSNIAMFTNLLMPSLGIFSLNWLGQLSTIMWVSFVSYAILKHRLFGIKFVIGKGLHLLFFILFPLVSFYLIVFAQSKIWGSVYHPGAILSGIVIAGGFSVVLLKFNKKFQRAVNYYLIYKDFDPEEVRRELINKLSRQIDAENMRKTLVSTIKRTIKPKSAKIRFAEKVPKTTKDTLTLPIGDDKNIKCFIQLGESSNTYGYTAEQINFLKSLAAILATALERARLHQKVQDFNEALKGKIQIATNDLEQKVKELKLAREREQEILDIMGHEIRTPAAVAKLSVEFVLAELKKGTISEAKVNKLLTSSLSGIDQQYNLAQTYITAAKLSKNTFSANTEPTKLDQLVSKSAEQFRIKAKEKGLGIVIKKSKIPMIVEADRQAVKQIVFNLIDNAIKYSTKGNITIDFRSTKKSSYFSIKDKGKGIPKDKLKNLGRKYYRIKTTETISGTGLGLYVVQGIVAAHKGKFEIESQRNKGTKFTVGLPTLNTIKMT